MRRPRQAAVLGRRVEPPAKRRRRFLLSRRSVGFSPFFRSLSRRLLYPVPVSLPRVTLSSKDKAPSRAAPPSKHPSSAHRRTDSPPPVPSSSSTSDDNDLDDEEDEEEQDMVDTVRVDFVFCNPEPGDFHGVKLLLRSYLGDRQWDLGGFVDLILEQTAIGTVVKSAEPEGEDEEEDKEKDEDEGAGVADDDEEGLYAVITVLNLGKYVSHQCISELKKYLSEVCHDDAVKKKLRPLLEGEQAHKTGLLVCERFVNFPHPPVPHLYSFLFDEISQASEDESTNEIPDLFHFKFYLILTRIYMKKDANVGKGASIASLGKKNRSSNSQRRRSEIDDSVIYTKAEDEIFHKLCSLSFTFDLSRNEQFVPPELKNYKEMGLVMVIESSKVPSFLKEIESFLSET